MPQRILSLWKPEEILERLYPAALQELDSALWRLYVEPPGNGPPAGSCMVKSVSQANPKIDPALNFDTEKDPDDGVSWDEPMTGAQASYLKTLSDARHR